jgi:hypothetical protein
MHSSCLAIPGKILWQYPISSVLWLACQDPVTSMPFRATDDFSFQSLLSSYFCPLILHHNPLSYTCSFILPLFHLPVPGLLLFTSLFSTSSPQLFSQPFLDHSFLTVLDYGLFCSLILLLVIIFAWSCPFLTPIFFFFLHAAYSPTCWFFLPCYIFPWTL